MAQLFSVIGKYDPEFLLAEVWGAHKIPINVEPGHGMVKRGTIVVEQSNGMFAPAAVADIATGKNLVILEDEVNSDANGNVAETAAAWDRGAFLASRLTLADGAKLTRAHANVLRTLNIDLREMMEDAADFENGMIAIVYKANGGVGNDVTVAVDSGSAYTIAANSFTAPDGKTFGGWNTAPDGTGTAYAAAASYTANDSLTLYAVWQ